MDDQHTQSVVDRAYAFVEDMFGLPHGDKTPYGEASPVVRMIPEEAGLTCDDAMGLEPEAHTSAENKQNLSPADLYADRPYG
jgi:hypothetical protein